MLVPLVQTLKAQLPGVSITWIIAEPAYSLVEGLDGVNFFVLKKPRSLSDYWAFRKQFKSKKFDVLLATQAAMRTNLLIPFIRAKRKIGYDKRRAKDLHRLFVQESIEPGFEHTLDGFLKFAKKLGLVKEPPLWNLPIRDEDYAWASKNLPQENLVIVMNPAASKPERSWHIDGYVAVIKHLQNKWKAAVVLTGGPTSYDRQLADALLARVSAYDLVGKTKPKQLLALISKAQLVLCPDTGPSHMATAMGTPVIALHAVTNPLISGPYNAQHLVINYYPKAMQTILNLPANEQTWGTQVHGDKAMHLIPVEEVIAQLDKTIARL